MNAASNPAERAATRKSAPSLCPYCGGTEVSMQVVAWGVFRSGDFQTFDAGEDVSYLPEAVAVCSATHCGGEFLWRQSP